MRNASGALAALLLLACGGHPAAAPSPAGGDLLYIVNQSGATISIIDQRRLTVDTVLDLRTMGFSANAKPHHVTVEPDGSYWYVTLIGDGRVLKLDRANHVVGQVRMETPGLVELDPTGDSLFVGRSMTAPAPPKSLGVIRRSTFTLVDEQEVQIPRPHALVMTRDGRWVHTASLAENTITSVNTATGRITLTRMPGSPRSLVQFTISPDGHTMVAGGELSNSVLIFDLTRPPPLTFAEVTVGTPDQSTKPWDPVFSRDGRSVFFSCFGANTVVQIDLAQHRVVRTITGHFAQPYDMIMRRDGKYLFVVNQNTGIEPKPGESGHAGMAPGTPHDGWLSVIDVASGRVVKELPLGNGPTGMGAAGAR